MKSSINWNITGCQILQRTCPLFSSGCLRLASSSSLPLVEKRIGSVAVRETWSVAVRRVSLSEAARRRWGPFLWKSGRAVFLSLPVHRSAEWGFPPSIAATEIKQSNSRQVCLFYLWLVLWLLWKNASWWKLRGKIVFNLSWLRNPCFAEGG